MADKIEFLCPHCGQAFRVATAMAGTRARCNQCHNELQVPANGDARPLLANEDPDQEVTPGGSIVHRHQPRVRGVDVTEGEGPHIERISDHIEDYLGPVEVVFHEIISDLVHLDVHWIPPTPDMPAHTLVTSGMSQRPMHTPEGMEGAAYAELMLRLPPDWPISKEAFRDENNYWPVHWLKMLARLPHEYDTWLFMEHTVPNGDPPEPFADNTNFCGWLIYPPLLVPEDFWTLDLDDERTVYFFAVYPLYLEEMNLKLEEGADALTDLLEEFDVSEIIDLERPNVALFNA